MSDSDDDNFAKFGNPLEPFEEDDVPRKKATLIQDQYAVDERGRRRFHGAFTGGFSAGYFNTVGTRDGWTPQQFKSSRSSKAGSVSQQPTDFMDEEDTSEFGIAPTTVRATDHFKDETKKNLKRLRSRQIQNQPFPGAPILQDFLVPARERIGIKLLKKMGWKPGQGIGPRITKKEKMQKRNELLEKYGCTETSEITKPDSGSDLSDDEYANIMLAPNDCEIKKPVPIDNYFGIGYIGLSKEPVLSQHFNLFEEPTLHIKEKSKKFSIRGQAFGVGAFEAEDEDIYSRDDMSQYDFSLEPKGNKKSKWSQKEKSKQSNCLEGFVPAKKPYQLSKTYEPPKLPKDFRPVHTFRQSRFFPPIEPPVVRSTKDKPVLNAHSRARILSDQPTTSNIHNVIVRTLNLEGREHQQSIEAQKQANAKPSWMDKLHVSNFIKAGTLATVADPSSSGSDLKKPFAYDADKQKRFEKYLEFSQNNQQDKLSSIQPLYMNEADREQEKTEFEQAIRLQSGSQPKKVEEPIENLGPEDAMKRAAKMKMFGKLTRRKEVWQPSSIVCKRFNVPEPDIGCAKPETSKKKKGFSVFTAVDWDALSRFEKSTGDPNVEVPFELPKSVEAKVIEKSDDKVSEHIESQKDKVFQENYQKVFQAEETVKDVEMEEQEADDSADKLEEKRDLFKSIFLSSSEDSDSEAEDKVNDDAVKSVLLGKSLNELNKQRNDSPPRGIFAKLDLDELVSSKKKVEVVEDEKSNNQQKESEKESSDKNAVEILTDKPSDELEPGIYGPILPSKGKLGQSTAGEQGVQRHIFRSVVVSKSTSKEGQWVEKHKSKKEKKKKEKEKEHKKKHKDKDKEKKKKSKKKKH